MTHFKSTIATAVFALTGLVVAQQVLYPRGDEPERPRPVAARTAEVAAVSAMAWIDPPAKTRIPSDEPTVSLASQAETVEPADAAKSTAPEPTAPVQTAASPPVRHVALPSEGAKKPDAAKRRRIAQNTARTRQVASRTPSPADAGSAVATQAQPNPPRVDPIGDLLRGLGIGGQG